MILARVIAWGSRFEGSTRAIALVRVGLALVIWVRFGREMALHSNTESWHLFVSIYFFVFTTMMLIGLYTRIAVPMVALILGVLYFVFGFGGIRPHWVAHHTYLLMSATALLSLTPCGRSYSVDRYRSMRRAQLGGEQTVSPEYGYLWGQRLIVLQMASLYFWTAFNKSGVHFLSGERLEATFMWAHTGRPLEAFFMSPEFIGPASLTLVIVEYFLAVGILVRRLIPVAVPLGISLHAALYLILPAATFSISMIVLYLAVLNPDSVHSVIDRLQGYRTEPHELIRRTDSA